MNILFALSMLLSIRSSEILSLSDMGLNLLNLGKVDNINTPEEMGKLLYKTLGEFITKKVSLCVDTDNDVIMSALHLFYSSLQFLPSHVKEYNDALNSGELDKAYSILKKVYSNGGQDLFGGKNFLKKISEFVLRSSFNRNVILSADFGMETENIKIIKKKKENISENNLKIDVLEQFAQRIEMGKKKVVKRTVSIYSKQEVVNQVELYFKKESIFARMSSGSIVLPECLVCTEKLLEIDEEEELAIIKALLSLVYHSIPKNEKVIALELFEQLEQCILYQYANAEPQIIVQIKILIVKMFSDLCVGRVSIKSVMVYVNMVNILQVNRDNGINPLEGLIAALYGYQPVK
ncbi:hypothetical protein SLOPH_1081 [Spraguea lophii 42_110]|uniref:Uncharacterized protein n=1 Tax=Spraguea lophii (strain 42_110) TaxID=1358809 RepID=S7W6Z5_SPRLO|nr:hypothetical protein SLOPH_1081 [Spraguea lophii 42_110]